MTAVEELVAKARREAVLQGLVSQVRLEIKFVGCLAHISTLAIRTTQHLH
jgi:hypothetical protein